MPVDHNAAVDESNLGADAVPHVFIQEEKEWTTSREVARCFGWRHASLLAAVMALQEELGEETRPHFRIQDESDAGGKRRTFVHMTRDGFALVTAGLKGARAAVMRLRFLEAFTRLGGKLLRESCRKAREARLTWREARSAGKLARKELTEALQELARQSGAAPLGGAMAASFPDVTRLIYAALLPGPASSTSSSPPRRDALTTHNLRLLALGEGMAAALIRQGVAQRENPEEIAAAIKSRLTDLQQAAEIPKATAAITGDTPKKIDLLRKKHYFFQEEH